jgi:uncharacterized repeat protein (TIGR01451 family)
MVMVDKKLVRHIHGQIAQALVLLLVLTGYPSLPVMATPGEPASAMEEDWTHALAISDGIAAPDQRAHGPARAPDPVDVLERPVSPQQPGVRSAAAPITTSFDFVLIADTPVGVHNDPSIDISGTQIAFWSTADLAQGVRPDHVVINEVYAYDRIAWLEIYNGNTSPVDMTGWRLIEYDAAGAIVLDYTFPAFSIQDDSYLGVEHWTCTDYLPYYVCTNSSYSYGEGINTGGAVALLNSSFVGVDFVRWGSSTVPPYSGTGWSGTNPPPIRYGYPLYQRLGRDKSGTDTDTGEDWCLQDLWSYRAPNVGCHNPDGNIEAFLAEIDATNQVTFTQLTFSIGTVLGGFSLGPTISRNGSRVAFFSDRDLVGDNEDENFEIFACDLQSQALTQITNTLRGANIFPSSNYSGTQIAFVSDRDLTGQNNDDGRGNGNQEIFVAQIDASWNITFTQVTKTTGDVINDQPSINSDGTRIAFVSNWDFVGGASDDNLEVFVADINPDGSITFGRVSDTSDDVNKEQPSISGDGTRVAYTRVSAASSRVYWAEVGSTAPHVQVSTGGSSNEEPAMSLQGDRIAFVSDNSVMLYYVAFASPPVVVAEVPSDTLPSRPAIATGDTYQETWVVFAAGGQLYRLWVPQAPELTISKTAQDAGYLRPGDRITYTIVVANIGGIPATSAVISDSEPANTTFVPNSITLDPPGAGTRGSSPPALAWNVTVPAYGQVTVTFAVEVDSGTALGTAIANTAGVTCAEIPTWTLGTATSVVRTPVLAVLKSASHGDPLMPGERITYTIAVANSGNQDATNAVISDTTPANTTFVPNSITLDPPGAGTVQGENTLVDGLTIAAGQAVTVTFEVTVDAGVPGGTSIANTAGVTCDQISTPVAGSVTSMVRYPELEVSKSATHNLPLEIGDVITYTILISNVGTGVATNVTVVDTLPPGTSYVVGSSEVMTYQAGTYLDEFGSVSYSNSNGSADWSTTPWTETGDPGGGPGGGWIYVEVSGSQQGLRFHDSRTSGGGSDTYWVERDVDLGGVTATTLAFRYDEDGGLEPEDQVTVSVFNGSIWHDVLTQSGNFDGWHSFGPQSIITYANADSRVRFQVTGFGGQGGQAEYLNVDDVAIAFERGSGPQAAGAPPNLVTAGDGWTLYPRQRMTVTFAVQVDPGLADGTTLVNTADIACDQVPTPVRATISSTVSAPDLTLTKSGPGPVNTGDRITYTIVVANSGSANATGAAISDTTPISTTFVPGRITLAPPGAGTIGGENTLVTGLTITAGQQVTVTFAVTADSAGTIRNTAWVTSSEVITPETDWVDTTVAATLFDGVFWVRDETLGNSSVAVALVGLPALIVLVAPARRAGTKDKRRE